MNGSRVCVKRIQIYAGADSPGSKKVINAVALLFSTHEHTNRRSIAML